LYLILHGTNQAKHYLAKQKKTTLKMHWIWQHNISRSISIELNYGTPNLPYRFIFFILWTQMACRFAQKISRYVQKAAGR